MHKRIFWLGLLLALQLMGFLGWAPPVLVGPVLVGPALAAPVLDLPAPTATSEESLFKEVWRIINRAYLDESFNHQNWWLVRQQELRHPPKTRQETYEAIETMLASLDDPFTRLLKPEQYRSLKVNTSGELMGVGLQIALDESGILEVLAPLAGSPAERAGIRARDRILAIDGRSTQEMTLDESAARMRGPVGTLVKLLLERAQDRKHEEIQLVRDRITINPVMAELHAPQEGETDSPTIGYVRLSQFSANATEEVTEAIQTLEQQGATAYILDLRGNPGGLLDAGVGIARLWIDRGAIVYTVNRQGVMGQFDATGQALTDAPLAVLVNRGTASASEILAGALHDNDRAQIVGERTFGKGLIQSLFDLSDGSGLAVTVAKYETPNGTDINKVGIMPDRVVSLDAIAPDQIGTPADPQYQAAANLLTAAMVTAGAF